jgi:hypothetical protein
LRNLTLVIHLVCRLEVVGIDALAAQPLSRHVIATRQSQGIGYIERIVEYVCVQVCVNFIPDGISLQELSVLTRFIVAAPISARRLMRVSGFFLERAASI